MIFNRFSEPVAGTDTDRNRIGAKIVEHGLPFEAGREVPVARNLEVESSTDVQTSSPSTDFIGRKTYGGIDFPVVAQMEDILGVETEIYRAMVVEQEHHRRLDSPVVGEAVTGECPQSYDSVTGVRVDVHARPYRPFPHILCRCGRGYEKSRNCSKKNLFHIFDLFDDESFKNFTKQK